HRSGRPGHVCNFAHLPAQIPLSRRHGTKRAILEMRRTPKGCEGFLARLQRARPRETLLTRRVARRAPHLANFLAPLRGAHFFASGSLRLPVNVASPRPPVSSFPFMESLFSIVPMNLNSIAIPPTSALTVNSIA